MRTFSAFMTHLNPRTKGWLKQYLSFREERFLRIAAGDHRASHPDFSLYKVIQPTGIMYGQPVTPLEFNQAAAWNSKDRLKVLLAECLIGSSLLADEARSPESINISYTLKQTLDNINNYYQLVFPELAASSRTFLGRKKDTLELAEEIFERRIDKIDLKGPFWVRFFQSSLLFLDVYIFGQWKHAHSDKVVAEFFHYERNELRSAVVRVMATAAHANRNIEFEERKLLEYFLQSAGLSAEHKKASREVFEHGLPVESLELPTADSWMLKKYFLEVAILTFWADKRVEEQELDLLHRLTSTLGLHPEDMENSLLAVEGFVLEHWRELDSLQDKKSFEEVSVQFIQRMAAIATKSKKKLLEDTRKESELMALLRQARSTELSLEDKEVLRRQLVDLLRRIPMLTMISLPEHFLTLPVLMQILPRNFMAEVLDGVA